MPTTQAPEQSTKGASIQINGQRVPLSPEGLEKAQAEHGNVGEKIVESVRQAVDRASQE
jgi:hypothetical protein